MTCEGCASRSRLLLPVDVGCMLLRRPVQQLREVVVAVAVATLGIGGVHRLEMGSDQVLVPDEHASLHVGHDRADPVDLGRGQGKRVLELQQDESRKAEVVLSHLERGIERRDLGAQADDAGRERRLGTLLGDVAEETHRDPEDRRLVDRGGQQIGQPVLELLTAFRRDPVHGSLRTAALPADLERLDISRRLQLLDRSIEAAGLAHRVPLVALLQEALELIRVARLLAEQAERGNRHHVLGLSAHFHIAMRTIACRTFDAAAGQSSACRATSWCASRYSRIARSAAMPSPTADPSCLVEPRRTSPAANTPGTEVVKPPLSSTKPRESRSTLPRMNSVLGSRPMKTKAACGLTTCSSPVSRSRSRTDSRRP